MSARHPPGGQNVTPRVRLRLRRVRARRGQRARADQPHRHRDAVGAGAGRYGNYAIGVRTLQATDKNRPDILNTKEGGPTARYDRTLTLEVWYPAALAAGQKPGGDYRAITRDPAITATLHGQAVRDAAPLTTEAPFPLVIISHGYPGQPLPDEPSRREPREQRLRHRVDRSQGQHLRRSEGVRAARSTTARSISCSC